MNKAEIMAQLKAVIDPELGINVVDLGLVYDVDLSEEGDVHVRMTLTTPGCPMHDTIAGGAERVLQQMPGVKSVRVEVVWSPPWRPDMMSDEAKTQLGFF